MAKNRTAFISLGSNIHPRREYIKKAIDQLRSFSDIEVCKISESVESPPLARMEGGRRLRAMWGGPSESGMLARVS